jgi:hypothetical protein
MKVEKFSDKVKGAIGPLLEQIRDVNRQINNYLVGVKHGLGLDDTWVTDVSKMEFRQEVSDGESSK